MVVHVRYNSWYISLPSSAKQQRKMTLSYVVWGREPRKLFYSRECLFGIERRVPYLVLR